MAAIRMHMVLTLGLTGCQNAHEAIGHSLQQANLNQIQPTVEIQASAARFGIQWKVRKR